MTAQVRKVTIIVLVIALVLLLAYDVIAVIMGGTNATISWVLWTESHNYPVIPLFVGILIGHLFASQTDAT